MTPAETISRLLAPAGMIRLVRHRAGRWRPDTVADGQRVRALIGKSYLSDSDYEGLLLEASRFGYAVETLEQP